MHGPNNIKKGNHLGENLLGGKIILKSFLEAVGINCGLE
jgi:hypothetical protein